MILSMTGFGSAKLTLPDKTLVIEVKSLNSKSLDISVTIPSIYTNKELVIRKLIGKYLLRGKIDFKIILNVDAIERSHKINKEAVINYMNQLQEIQPKSSEFDRLKIAMKLPDIFKLNQEEISKQEWNAVEKTIEEALENLNVFRREEGTILERNFILRISDILRLLQKVKTIESKRINTIKTKLLKALTKSQTEINKDRFEQELIYYLEKLDITEELVRLQKHCDYFSTELKVRGANGKKLGFITQEIGREINTIGAKSNYAPMQKIVVQMKDELEKIKEQILNIL